MQGRYPPPRKGYLSDTCAIPYENKANGCDTPLCDTISKGYCTIWGGISHWAAKGVKQFVTRLRAIQSNIFRELRNIYHHHPESKKRKSSEANSGSIHPYGRYENAVKTRKTISTIAILWPVKVIFEKRAATVEVDSSFFRIRLKSWGGTSAERNCPREHFRSIRKMAPKTRKRI